jgi:tRNA (uracil-5-)-methyltransferase TRM9
MEFEITNVKNIYENIANEFSDKRMTKWDWIDNFIYSFPKYSTLLDLGCGSGRNMEYSDYIFYGIDNCKNFIKIAKNKNLNVALSDMTSLPFNNETFDGIISIASFHHLSTNERRRQCLEELKRISRINSKILLSIWSINQSHNKRLNNKFTYGNNIVPFKDNKGNVIGNRYYYIFKLEEIKELLSEYFTILSHEWIHGNEVFILSNN